MNIEPAEWQAHRRYLFAVAYRLLGTVSEAEDAVQETYLRLRSAAPAALANPRAWLATVVSRVRLDMLTFVRSDGGGTVPAPPEPVRGAARVAALLIGLGRLYAGIELRMVSVAGAPGVLSIAGDTLVSVTSVEVVAGRLSEINFVLNPAKLRSTPLTVDDRGAIVWYRDGDDHQDRPPASFPLTSGRPLAACAALVTYSASCKKTTQSCW
jgi:hypothetical protein